MKIKSRSHRYGINRLRCRYGHIVNIKTVSVYVLSNTQAISEAQFMKKLSNTEAELKKALLIKKCVMEILNKIY